MEQLNKSSDQENWPKTLNKQCAHCKLMLGVSFFYKKKRGYLGVDSKCKQCVLLSKHARYKKIKRSRLGIIEVTDDNGSISETAVHIFTKHLRYL